MLRNGRGPANEAFAKDFLFEKVIYQKEDFLPLKKYMCCDQLLPQCMCRTAAGINNPHVIEFLAYHHKTFSLISSKNDESGTIHITMLEEYLLLLAKTHRFLT